ncbi:EscU/YscU/HrcU family type III secretion system export apparatus switch protein [Shewanella waksmanii]|uniref:EscU/YscU/HrcU family type III secretion system export apparatus switch protein n=1 Tax=Shewanella waksmanii TaxID=213783 RepID=UPI0037361245
MSEESTEPKKYPASEKKLKDLKKKGQFPRTELVEPTIELFVFSFIFTIFLYVVFTDVGYWIEVLLYLDNEAGVKEIMAGFYFFFLLLFLIKFAGFIFNSVVINKAVYSFEELGFKIEKISPVTGFKNIFGMQALSKSLRKVIEVVLLVVLAKYVFDLLGNKISELIQVNNITYFTYMLIVYIGVASSFFIIYGLVIGCIDYVIERYHFLHKNRMTFTELKNEMKETEGSEEIKGERKRQMKAVMEEVPKVKGRTPTFALANPTHILIPICFDERIDKLPVVLKICTDFQALEQRQALLEAKIPVIEHKPLARAFYRKMSVGNDFIPKEFYKEVAFILLELKKNG